jgi:hypothetical protein
MPQPTLKLDPQPLPYHRLMRPIQACWLTHGEERERIIARLLEVIDRAEDIQGDGITFNNDRYASSAAKALTNVDLRLRTIDLQRQQISAASYSKAAEKDNLILYNYINIYKLYQYNFMSRWRVKVRFILVIALARGPRRATGLVGALWRAAGGQNTVGGTISQASS